MEKIKKDTEKKILIFSWAYYPLVGGAEIAVKEITDRISNIVFDMVTFRFNKEWRSFERIGNVNVYRINSPKLLFPFVAFFKAIELHYKNKYDIAWSIMANRAGFASLFFKTFYPKVKYVLTLQEGDTFDHPENKMGILRLLLRRMFRMIFIKADRIQAISNHLAEWARNMGAKGEIKVIPNGVDLDIFLREISQEDIDLTHNFLGENHGIKKDDKLIITTSRLVEKNAIKDIIGALKFLPDNIKLLIAGVGPLRDKLEKQTRDENLEDRVVFLGLVDYKDISKYLKISEVFVRPSLSEGFGNSFIEAMAVGIPVVATPVGGIVDFLKDEETGLFCKVRNPQSVAEKIKIFLENPELKNKIVENSRRMVIENYDWNIVTRDMADLFQIEKIEPPLYPQHR